METITFLLAPLGYAGLALATVLAVRRTTPLSLWRVTALVIAVHVLLVWWVRYEWQLSKATRNGPAGFLLFHSALAAIFVSTICSETLRRRLLLAAFAAVTLGAFGAVFKYEEVAVYRAPVIACGASGWLYLAYLWRRNRHRRSTS